MEKIPRVARRAGAVAQVVLLSWSAGVSAPASSPVDPTPAPQKTDAARTVHFSGYDWKVKASVGTFGPGPNFFSSSPTNVWVDTRGRLHLKITHRNGQFQCA